MDGIFVTIFLLFVIKKSSCIHCDKELNYHDNYGYGFDISCEGLTRHNEKMLKDISVYNEIMLEIANSDLRNSSADLFQNVGKIKCLTLRNSTITHSYGNPLKFLDNLQNLVVDNSEFNYFNKSVFQRFDHLIELEIVNNNLSFINATALKVLNNLETLVLNNNSIKNVSQIPVCDLLKLKRVSLRGNQIELIPKNFVLCSKNMSRIYHGLLLSLTFLDFSYNKIKSFDSFQGAYKLRHLNLQNNRLETLSANMFRNLTCLEKLILANNNLTKIHRETFGVKFLKNLRTIQLENNNLINVNLSGLINLQNIYLSHNKITTQTLKTVNNLQNLKLLLLDYNNIGQIPENFVLNLPSLETLDLSHNNLILTHNNYSIFSNLSSLKQLHLGHNNLATIRADCFKNLTNLESLDLSQNHLTQLDDAETFSRLENLRLLNISYNYLDYINYRVFEPLLSLQSLDIAGNRLRNFQFDLISSLPALRIINIKANLLSCDVLAEIISYLRRNKVDFNVNESFYESSYDRKNIAGIYCDETDIKRGRIGSTYFAAVGFVVVLVAFFAGFVVYKRWVLYSKRRGYLIDEIELIED